MPISKVTCIIQARMGSSRLPGKVLKLLLGRPVLYWDVYRIKQCKLIDDIVVATSALSRDDAIVELCKENHWQFYRGSESDVLDRYYHGAKQFHAEVIVRITSDCPLIDPDVSDNVVSAFLHSSPALDYMSNLSPQTYPQGLDTEVFHLACLEKAWSEDKEPASREHVTPYIYSNPGKFLLGFITNESDCSQERWVLDTPNDFAFIEKVYTHFGHANFRWQDVLSFIKEGEV